jgi:hypothetical protein
MSSAHQAGRHRAPRGRERHRPPSGPAAARFLAAGALGSAALMALPAGPALAADHPAVPAPSAGGFGAGAQPVQLFSNLAPVTPSLLDQLRGVLANGSGSVSVSGYPLGIFGGSLGLTLGADGGALSVGAGIGMGGDIKVSAADTPPATSLGAQIVGQVSTNLTTPAGTTIMSGKAQVNFNILNPAGSSATGQLGVGPVQFSQTMPLGNSAVSAGPNASDQGGGGAGAQTVAFRPVSFGSQVGVQAVGTIPFTYEGLVHALALIGGTEAGLTVDQIFPPPTPQQVIDGDFAQLASSSFLAQHALMPPPGAPVGPAVPYLVLSTPDGLLNTATGAIIAPGEPVSPVTGLPDSAGGTTGAAILPGPPAPSPPLTPQQLIDGDFAQFPGTPGTPPLTPQQVIDGDFAQFPGGPGTPPPAAVPAPAVPGTQAPPFYDPFTGVRLSALDPATAPDGIMAATAATPAASAPASPALADQAPQAPASPAAADQAPADQAPAAPAPSTLTDQAPAPSAPADPAPAGAPVASPVLADQAAPDAVTAPVPPAPVDPAPVAPVVADQAPPDAAPAAPASTPAFVAADPSAGSDPQSVSFETALAGSGGGDGGGSA